MSAASPPAPPPLFICPPKRPEPACACCCSCCRSCSRAEVEGAAGFSNGPTGGGGGSWHCWAAQMCPQGRGVPQGATHGGQGPKWHRWIDGSVEGAADEGVGSRQEAAEAWRQRCGTVHAAVQRGGMAHASAPHGSVDLMPPHAQETTKVRGQGLQVGGGSGSGKEGGGSRAGRVQCMFQPSLTEPQNTHFTSPHGAPSSFHPRNPSSRSHLQGPLWQGAGHL